MLRISALVALTLLAACGKDKDKDSGPTTTPSVCTDLTATAADNVSTAVTFSWSGEATGDATVTLDLEGEGSEITTLNTTGGPDYSVTAVGMVSGGEYQWEAVVDSADGPVSCGVQTVKVAPAPTVILKFDLNISEPGSAVADGYLVLSTLQADTAWNAIVDGQGRYRFIYGTDDPTYTVAHTRWSRDGESLLWNQFDRDRILDVGSIARVSLDGKVDTRTRTTLAHHDFVELPDGSFGWLGYDRRDFAMDQGSAPLGAEFNLHCPAGQCPVAGEVILEGAEGITEDNQAVEILNWWDDWDTDPWWVCDHMWDFGGFVPDHYEWFHANSLAYVDSEDAYFVMSRYQDTLFKVDRASGSIVWQMGGLDSDFAITSGEFWDHGHMSDVWEGGFMVFDNGDHRGYSRVTEYAYDEAAREVSVVWTMDHPSLQLLPILGDVKRLPNGNRLIVWSADAVVQEVTPTGEVVWELQSSSGGFGVVARADFVEALPTQLD